MGSTRPWLRLAASIGSWSTALSGLVLSAPCSPRRRAGRAAPHRLIAIPPHELAYPAAPGDGRRMRPKRGRPDIATHPHDGLVKYAFSKRHHAKGLLRAILPAPHRRSPSTHHLPNRDRSEAPEAPSAGSGGSGEQ